MQFIKIYKIHFILGNWKFCDTYSEILQNASVGPLKNLKNFQHSTIQVTSIMNIKIFSYSFCFPCLKW